MSATGGIAMGKMLRGLLLSVVLSGTSLAQQLTISGTVTNAGGVPLRGVTVRAPGEARTVTGINGRYTITAPADAVLSFSILGQRLVQTRVEGRTTIDVSM